MVTFGYSDMEFVLNHPGIDILALRARAMCGVAQDAEIHLGVNDPYQGGTVQRCRSSSMQPFFVNVETCCRAWPLLPAASSSSCVS